MAGEREREKKARLEKYPAIYAFNYAAAILRRINIACASQPLIKSSLDAVPRSFMQAACLEEKMAEDGAERVVDKRGPGVGKGKKLPLQSFIKCMHMRGHRVHDENCETTARRFCGRGRGGKGRVKNARAASSRKIREAVFSLGHAIKGGKFDTSENRKFCKVLNL